YFCARWSFITCLD
nr:immunoglobulin heavy chain junction region [Mus musculus]